MIAMKTRVKSIRFLYLLLFVFLGFSALYPQQKKAVLNLSAEKFEGKHFCGSGDVEYIKLLEIARRMFEPDPEFPNISMLYNSDWNSMVEGPTWRAWWIQNSYGTTYCALPFYQEPYLTFLQNAQDFWFDLMGDGKRKGVYNWQPPDGALCDCANPDWIIYKQGDGKTDIHDWGIGFAAAGIVLQSELLLISRDMTSIAYYLPLLERTANFLDSRRDPKNNLFLAGPAGNLLAPSYAGWLKPDGTYDKAYLAEISITYIAALDRLIELEKLSSNLDKVKLYTERRELAKKGLPLITTDEGYILRSIDPDGTKHGVYGAKKHGYLETTPNHDAIAFHVVDQKQANKIYNKIASIPELRPYKLIIPNYPAYDDMYEKEVDIWKYGTWINGGHWSTCEGRMMMAYSILGKFEDSRQSMLKILDYAKKFRMDNPLTDFGNDVYQPKMPYNVTYDAYAIPAAFIRGLFEYIYKADGLTLIPHIPESISELQQLDPIRFGSKKIFLSYAGKGEISSVLVNGQKYSNHTKTNIFLPFKEIPDSAHIVILSGNIKPDFIKTESPRFITKEYRDFLKATQDTTAGFPDFKFKVIKLYDFYKDLCNEGLKESYEATHAKLVVEAYRSIFERRKLLSDSKIQILPPESSTAADRLYYETAEKHCRSIENLIRSYKKSKSLYYKKIYEIYQSIRNEYPG
jgi:hypothetical protein